MKLDRTKALMLTTITELDPNEALVRILESAIELVQIPDNDFSWSHWENSEQATKEITQLLELANSCNLPERVKISVLFAPTGPLQEVSLSSGWAESFLKVAEKYDQIENLVWPDIESKKI